MLEAVQLSRSAPDGKLLLDRAGLRVSGGGRYGIFGPTGSGKTLFLRAMALLDRTDSGEVRWQGMSIADADVPAFRRRVIYLHQRPALIEGSTIDNLRLPWSFRSSQATEFDRERALRYLNGAGQSEAFFPRQTSKLSGGERQIVALVRAMLLEPQVLLLDEPTSALDTESARKVESLIQTYLDEAPDARASVWVTHDAEQLRRVADWRVPIEAGRTGEPERVG